MALNIKFCMHFCEVYLEGTENRGSQLYRDIETILFLILWMCYVHGLLC